MMEALVVSQLLLWIVIILLALLCLALARQVGVLYERIAPAGALAINKHLAGGDLAPVLSLTTLTGRSVNIGRPDHHGDDIAKSQLLFFLSPSCPVCKTLLPILKAIQHHEGEWLTIVLASDGDTSTSHTAFVQQQGLEKFDYVLSETLGLQYGVSKLPYAVLIDESGRISALGIVNSREHIESLFEARVLGKSTIQEYLSEVEEQHKKIKDLPTELVGNAHSTI